MSKQKSGSQKVNFYDFEELKIPLDLIKNLSERNKLMIEATLYGGLRRGEVLSICDDVITWSKNQIMNSRSLQYTKRKDLRLKGTKTENIRIVIYPRIL